MCQTLYWAIITMTSTGYGDISPKVRQATFCVICSLLCCPDPGGKVRSLAVRDLRRVVHHSPHPHHRGQLQQVGNRGSSNIMPNTGFVKKCKVKLSYLWFFAAHRQHSIARISLYFSLTLCYCRGNPKATTTYGAIVDGFALSEYILQYKNFMNATMVVIYGFLLYII